MIAVDRLELDQLAKVLAALLAAWWLQHARAEAREDDLAEKGRSTRGGGR